LFFQSLLSLHLFDCIKKRKREFVLLFYGRFLSTMTMITMLMMATNKKSPTMAGIKYMSAADSAGGCVGVGVAGASDT
jgi:hypothetical protein